MTEIRPTTKKWTLDKHEFYAVYHYALNYEKFVRKRAELKATELKGLAYDGMPHSKDPGDPTGSIASQIAEYTAKIEAIEDTAKEVDPVLAEFILYAATHDVSYEYLRYKLEMPCGHSRYYELRRKYYYLLSKKIF